jgi:hypothetical protein
MSCFRVAVIAAVLFTSLASTAAAQAVRGQVRESGTGAPVQAAMIVLLDEQGEQQARVFSDVGGRFLMRAPAPGRYQLRMELIGFRNAETDYFDVGPEQVVDRNIDARLQAVVLEGITVESARRCVVRPDEGLAVATLWQEARKALEATSAATAQRLYTYEVNRYTRRLDRRTLRVIEDSSTAHTGHSDRSPYLSLPAEHLLARGFIETEEDGTILYHAPDANVLLSSEFADAYCFRPVQGADGLVGIAFEPSARRGPPAIQGTLWLNADGLALRHLEYRYARAELPQGAEAQVGGRVEFEALPTGAWIVRRWWIRMPVLELSTQWWRAPGVRLQPALAGYTEDGAEVLEVLAASGARVGGAQLATLTGTVLDSVTGMPLAGAEVYLSGTSYRTVADETGAFEMRGLPEGDFTLGFMHPRLALYGLGAGPAANVSLARGQTHVARLGVPAAAVAGGLAATCREALLSGRRGEFGVLRGVVRDELSGVTLPGALVRLSWDAAAEGELPDPREVQVRTGTDGSYVACGVPEDRSIDVQVTHLGRAGSDFALDPIGPAGYGERVLALRVSRPVPVVFMLQDFQSGQPIAAARVTLPELGAAGLTDAAGRVSFEVPPGAVQLRIEHLAYGAHDRDVTVGLDPATFEVRVPSTAVALEGITVTVRRAAEVGRRASGVRQDLMTRSDLENFSNRAEHVGHVVNRFPGLQVAETHSGVGGLRDGLCIEMRRAKTSSDCAPVLVIIDDIPITDLSILLALQPDAMESVEFLPPSVAGMRWGTGSMNGALVIYTRGRGPYAGGRSR